MAEKRRGLGRGLGALIPNGPSGHGRPVDVFFPGGPAVVAEERPADSSAPPTEESPTGADKANVPTDEASAATSTTSTETVTESPDGTIAESVDQGQTASAQAAGDVSGGDPTPGTATPDIGDPAQRTAGAPSSSDARDPDSDNQVDGDLVPVPGASFAEIPIDQIRANPRQPRTVFDEDALAELVGSIREIGVLQPIVVRPTGEVDGPRYELIMGERRWRATIEAELATIPAIIRETDDNDLLRDALLENLHRSQLNPLEEAAAYRQLLDDFDCTHDELADRIHRSRPQISNTLRLLRLPPLVQRRVAAGVLSAGHARALLGLPDAGAMERLAQRIVAEGISVRATEEIVALGGDDAPEQTPRAPRAGDRNAALDELAGRLSDRFDTRVKIALGKRKGRLTVEFASVQDLNRILDAMSPDDPGLLR